MKRALPLLALTVLGACEELEEGVDCTTEAIESLVVHVEDEAGWLSGIPVEYAVDGGAFQLCEDYADGDYGCGWEERGAFEVRIEDDAFHPYSGQVQVGGDACHVVTETLDVLLVDVDEDP
jgi:hypothetical protein